VCFLCAETTNCLLKAIVCIQCGRFMMMRNLRFFQSVTDRFEPQLGSLEHAYRQANLTSDKAQIRAVVTFYMIAMFMFASVDYQLFDVSVTFFVLTASRVAYLGASTFLIINLGKLKNENHIDQHVFNWSCATSLFIIFINSSRSTTFFYNIPIDSIVILNSYFVIHNNFFKRFFPAMLLTIGDITLMLFFRAGVLPAGIRSSIISLILANIVGIIISTRLYNYRRNQFRSQEDLKQAKLEIERVALTDPLTELPNRRKFFEVTNEELRKFKRSKQAFHVLYIDLDHFKTINDTYGHANGDQLLIGFAQLSKRETRETDTVGRLGGEEFAVLLPETSARTATDIAERIRNAMQSLVLPTEAGPMRTTLSIGVAEILESDDSIDTILHRADEALYKAKNNGRNLVVMA
jgi:diguanylate cyclase (GGDEF)-like protein